MGMSSSYGPPKDKQEMISLLRKAVDRSHPRHDEVASAGREYRSN
jgi:hypothetical protein